MPTTAIHFAATAEVDVEAEADVEAAAAIVAVVAVVAPAARHASPAPSPTIPHSAAGLRPTRSITAESRAPHAI